MVTKVVECSKTGESGNKETPNHMHNPIANSGPRIAKPKLTQRTALSQPLLVPEECDRVLRQA